MSSVFHSPEVCVVEASAGSGKTYALARRYVRLILFLSNRSPLQNPPVHSILAITFTNKAAFEMKERILRFLKELALGVMPSEDAHDMLLGLDISVDEAGSLARRVIDTILRNYNYFQVETIDKFINTLLVGSAFQVGLTANFRIKTSSREYLTLALDELIDDASRHPVIRKSFDDFLISMLLVEARSAWIPKAVMLDTMVQLFREYNTHGAGFVPGGVVLADMIKVKSAVITDVGAFVEKMPEGAHKTFAASLSKFVRNHQHSFRFADKLSDYFHKNKSIPSTKALIVTSWHEDQWEKIQRGFMRAADMEVRHLYDPYVAIFERVRERFTAASLRDDVIFLEELNTKARLVYQQGLLPEELYYRLSTRFEHYLFDEFQDTSVLQWENLKVLPEDGISKGGSLFYVGDKKQAIYSFRGGDTGLFDEVRLQYDDPGYHLTVEKLDISRRSHASIVTFNNSVFGMDNLNRFMAMTDKDGDMLIPARPMDTDELKRVYGSAAQRAVLNVPAGYVRVERTSGGNKEERSLETRLKVIERLGELRGRFALKDIGILVRKNDDVQEVTRWLLEENIPSSSERTLNIKEHALVNEVCAFLRFLVSPIDDAAFGEFIQGEMLIAVSGLSKREVQHLILDWRQEKRDRLYTAFRRACPDVWETFIEDFFRNAGLYPIYETVASFYRKMNVLSSFPGAEGFLMRFLDLVKDKEAEFPDMGSFLAHYEELTGDDLYVDVTGGDAVQVMTVHKAKGLEFKVVILPFLTMTLTRSRSPKNLALEYSLRQTEEGLVLYHFNEQHTHYSDKAEALSTEDKMRRFFSELNNVYVALTRAACEMYIFIPSRAGKGTNLALYLIPENFSVMGEPAKAYPIKNNDTAVVAKDIAPPLCRDWISFLKDEFLSEDALTFQRQREEGVLYHEVLSKISYFSSDPSSVLKKAYLEVSETLTDDMKEILSSLLALKGLGPLFSDKNKVLIEQEISDRFGRTWRVDRLVISPEYVTVVDFKLSMSQQGEGESQVRGYMELLKDLYPGRIIKGCLIFIKECYMSAVV